MLLSSECFTGCESLHIPFLFLLGVPIGIAIMTTALENKQAVTKGWSVWSLVVLTTRCSPF